MVNNKRFNYSDKTLAITHNKAKENYSFMLLVRKTKAKIHNLRSAFVFISVTVFLLFYSNSIF